MGCYEIESTPMKLKLNDKPPSICNVWDPMDSFDGLFLEEDLDETDSGFLSSKLKSELDLLVKNVSPAQPASEESVRGQNKSDEILGPHPPYFAEIGKIKDRFNDENLMEFTRDDKVNIDKVKYTIPNKRYAKPFKEKLSSQTLHLAPMENHQNFFKGNCPKWPKVRSRDSHERISSQHKVYRSSSNSSQPVGRHKVRHVSEWTPP
jgi:hypothetical protein